MRIQEELVRRITILDVPRLDPVRVTLEDIEPGKGRVAIDCYGDAWSCYWGGMGSSTISEFIQKAGPHYIAGKLSNEPSDVYDPRALEKLLREKVLQSRRKNEIPLEKARELWDEIGCIEDHDHTDYLYHCHFDLLQLLIGDDWWVSGLPQKPNPKYEYLLRIIAAVKEGLAKADGKTT